MKLEELYNYPSNSDKSKKIQEKPKKIISGTVSADKSTKSNLRHFVTDTIPTAGKHVFTEVIIPALKNLLFEGISRGSSMMIFGEDRKPSNTVNKYLSAYNNIYNYNPNKQTTTTTTTKRTDRPRYDNLKFEKREDAKLVLDTLGDMISTYGHATLSSVYEMIGLESTITTVDNGYGWNDISNAVIVEDEGAWLLVLPKPKVI